MALYAIGDLHLSLGAEKPMDIFGGAWDGYMDKLEQGITGIREEDTTILLGDLSWALSLEEAKLDFAWINKIPGKKIILKGNHDYWWSTAAKFRKFCEENGFSNMSILHNNHYEYNGWAICGTRGWFFEERRSTEQDEKVFRRELIRLETSLKSAGDLPKMVFLHYPPRYRDYTCPEILELLERYHVSRCFYGHLHGPGQKMAQEGLWDDVDYRLVSADKLNFRPFTVISESFFQKSVDI